MKKRMILLAGILTASLSFSALTWAEETPKKSPGEAIGDLIVSLLEDEDVQEAIFGDEGLIHEVLPEGIDLGEIAEGLEEKAEVIKAEGEQLIESVIDKVRDEDGSINLEGLGLDGLGDLVGELAGALTGSGDLGGYDLDYYFARFDAMKAAVKEYALEKSGETMETGDAQIVSTVFAYEDDDMGDELRALPVVDQSNFTADGTDLLFLNGYTVPILFTLNWDEENSCYTVADAKETADGEEFAASLQEMCDEVGCSFDECLEDIELVKIFHLGDMRDYLNEHPEYERIELEGELRTADELDQIYSDRLTEFFAEEDTDSMPAEVESVETVVVEDIETVPADSAEEAA